MTFLWPEMLWLAGLLPLLVLVYVWLLRRRKKVTLRFASLALVKQAAGKSIGWRRHVPPVLLLAGFGALVVSAARPVAVLQLPTQQQTIILAMDVSGSMRATTWRRTASAPRRSPPRLSCPSCRAMCASAWWHMLVLRNWCSRRP